MIEVFKTNVDNHAHAFRLLKAIHGAYPTYRANFDLDDCDKILRIESLAGVVDHCGIISLLTGEGYSAEVLEPCDTELWIQPLLQKFNR